MKIVSKITLSMAVASSIFFIGCGDTTEAAKPKVATTETATSKVVSVSEESLGLRKTDLYSEGDETAGEKTKYGTDAATTSKTISRAFQDAPPMIPHDVSEYLPIKISTNACLDCHTPGVAESMGALPYPISHMTDFRPKTGMASNGKVTKDGREIENTSSEKLANVSIKDNAGRLAGARFNCSQCHAPQSQVDPLVKNNFEADFTSKDGASKSSWNGGKLTDGLDTLIK